MPIYLKFAPVKGLSTAFGHAQWIELTSCTMDGKNDLQCTKLMDGNSPELLGADRLNSTDAIIDFVKPGAKTYLRLELSGAVISRYTSTVTRANETPIDSFTLNYANMQTHTYSLADQILSEIMSFLLPIKAIPQLAAKIGQP